MRLKGFLRPCSELESQEPQLKEFKRLEKLFCMNRSSDRRSRFSFLKLTISERENENCTPVPKDCVRKRRESLGVTHLVGKNRFVPERVCSVLNACEKLNSYQLFAADIEKKTYVSSAVFSVCITPSGSVIAAAIHVCARDTFIQLA